MRLAVYDETADVALSLRRLRRGGVGLVVARVAPQLGLDPRHELQRVEGLCDIVVRAYRETHDLVDVLDLGREHYDGPEVLLAYARAEREAGDVREHDGEYREIELLGPDALERVMAVIELADGKALVFQI